MADKPGTGGPSAFQPGRIKPDEDPGIGERADVPPSIEALNQQGGAILLGLISRVQNLEGASVAEQRATKRLRTAAGNVSDILEAGIAQRGRTSAFWLDSQVSFVVSAADLLRDALSGG